MKLTKKLMVSALAAILTLTGCTSGGGNEKTISESEEKNEIVIGISQIAEHSALDNVRQGFKDAMEEFGVDVKYLEENAQGDVSNSNLIAQKFVKENVDLILAIATPSAQAAKTATSDIPIVFSAVTDPIKAELVNPSRAGLEGEDTVEDKNISGTTDATPIKKQLELFKQINPDINKVGVIYNTAEVNSQVQVEQAVNFGKEVGIDIVTAPITNINEMPQAIDSLVEKVDGIYTITDNLVANAITLVAEKANEHKLVSIGAERAHVEGGILMTDGISYYNSGKQAAEIAKKVLIDKADISTIAVEQPKQTEKVVNEDTMNLLGLSQENQAFENSEFIKNKNL